MKRIFLSACIIMSAIFTHAQKDSTIADTFYTLSPVEVRATRLSQKAPFAITNVSEKNLQKQNLGQGLPYLLNQTPSLTLSADDGAGVGYSSLRIRGTDITRINVTFNGIPVNDAESQGAFFVDIPDMASSTNSIQVQRGVGSSTNGAGAFGASINISNLEQSKEPTATISNAYGSFDTWKHTLRAATGLLPGGFQFDVRLSKISSTGYIDRAFSDLKSAHVIGSWTSKNAMTNIKFNVLTGRERTGQAWNGIGISYTDATDPASFDYEKELDKIGRKTNTLGQIDDDTYYNDQTDNYQQDYYQLFINQKFNQNWTANISGFMTRGKGYYNEYKADEAYADYGLDPYVKAVGDTIETTNLIRQLWLDNYYYGSVFSLKYNTQATDFTIGGGWVQYDAKHYGYVKWADAGIPLDYRWYRLTAFKTDYNVFAKLQQEIMNGLYAFADVQFRYVNYDINGFRKNPDLFTGDDYRFFNPKAGLSYVIKHDATKLSKVYGSFAIANKEPNRDDFEAQSTKPKPEHLNDFEAGYQYNAPFINAGINGYYMQYKDQLILTGQINDVGAYTRTNVNDSYRAGIELTADAKLLDYLQVFGNATFSKNKIKKIVQFSDDYDNGGQIATSFHNTDIAFSPNTIVSAGLTWQPFYKMDDHHHFYIDVLGKYISRQYLDNASDKMKSINAYTLTDMRLRYSLSSGILKDMSVIVLLNNIFNKKYENNGYTFSYRYEGAMTTENYYFPQAGFNWNIGVSFTF